MRQIRDAGVEDAATLCNAEREIVSAFDGMLVSEPDELEPASFQERIGLLSDGRGKYLVAESAGQIVAHASLWPMGLRRLAHVVRLEMCVHAGHWRRGHGQALLSELLKWARNRPEVHKVELLVRSENTPALALYNKFGFFEEGRLRDRVRLRNGRFIDDVSMALLLRANGR